MSDTSQPNSVDESELKAIVHNSTSSRPSTASAQQHHQPSAHVSNRLSFEEQWHTHYGHQQGARGSFPSTNDFKEVGDPPYGQDMNEYCAQQQRMYRVQPSTLSRYPCTSVSTAVRASLNFTGQHHHQYQCPVAGFSAAGQVPPPPPDDQGKIPAEYVGEGGGTYHAVAPGGKGYKIADNRIDYEDAHSGFNVASSAYAALPSYAHWFPSHRQQRAGLQYDHRAMIAAYHQQQKVPEWVPSGGHDRSSGISSFSWNRARTHFTAPSTHFNQLQCPPREYARHQEQQHRTNVATPSHGLATAGYPGLAVAAAAERGCFDDNSEGGVNTMSHHPPQPFAVGSKRSAASNQHATGNGKPPKPKRIRPPSSIGEHRLKIRFENLGTQGEIEQTFGRRGGRIPNGLSGRNDVYNEPWRFQIRHHRRGDRVTVEWIIRNITTNREVSRRETLEESIIRESQGKTICNQVLKQALEERAQDLEAELNLAHLEANVSRVRSLESRVKALRPNRCLIGLLFFGLQHQSVQMHMAKMIGKNALEKKESSLVATPVSTPVSSASSSMNAAVQQQQQIQENIGDVEAPIGSQKQPQQRTRSSSETLALLLQTDSGALLVESSSWYNIDFPSLSQV